MAEVNATDVQRYLSGANFPCSKQQIISQAKSKGAPNDIVSAFNGLPDREYSNSADVSSELDLDM